MSVEEQQPIVKANTKYYFKMEGTAENLTATFVHTEVNGLGSETPLNVNSTDDDPTLLTFSNTNAIYKVDIDLIAKCSDNDSLVQTLGHFVANIDEEGNIDASTISIHEQNTIGDFEAFYISFPSIISIGNALMFNVSTVENTISDWYVKINKTLVNKA